MGEHRIMVGPEYLNDAWEVTLVQSARESCFVCPSLLIWHVNSIKMLSVFTYLMKYIGCFTKICIFALVGMLAS